MQLFYLPDISQEELFLSGQEARHAVQVLRKQPGEMIRVTDGKGYAVDARIEAIRKDGLILKSVSPLISDPNPIPRFHLVIAPTKNQDRMEWMLEKLTETGLASVQFIQTERTEKSHLRLDRLEAKMISAMKQSNRYTLPVLKPMISFQQALAIPFEGKRLMAVCFGERFSVRQSIEPSTPAVQGWIGPEGDFTPAELNLAMKSGLIPLSLGEARLRTETAALTFGILTEDFFRD